MVTGHPLSPSALEMLVRWGIAPHIAIIERLPCQSKPPGISAWDAWKILQLPDKSIHKGSCKHVQASPSTSVEAARTAALHSEMRPALSVCLMGCWTNGTPPATFLPELVPSEQASKYRSGRSASSSNGYDSCLMDFHFEYSHTGQGSMQCHPVWWAALLSQCLMVGCWSGRASRTTQPTPAQQPSGQQYVPSLSGRTGCSTPQMRWSSAMARSSPSGKACWAPALLVMRCFSQPSQAALDLTYANAATGL